MARQMTLIEKFYSDFVEPYGLMVLAPIWLKLMFLLFKQDISTFVQEVIEEAIAVMRLNPGLRMINFVGVVLSFGVVIALIQKSQPTDSPLTVGILYLLFMVVGFLFSIRFVRNERR